MDVAEPNERRSERRSHLQRHRVKLITVAVLVVFLIALRLTLPLMVKAYVNRALDSSPGYSGHVDDIHLALWRGSYSIIGLEVRQQKSAERTPLFSSPRTELSVLWSGLLQGAVVATIKTYDARLTFAAGHSKNDAQTGRDANWGDVLKKLSPFSIDHFEVVDSEVHYVDRYSDPKVDVYLTHVNGAIDNLTNRELKSGDRVATLHAKALAMDQATLDLDLRVDPYADTPNFDLKLRLLNLEATRMKDFVRAYTLFDPKSGTLDVVIEANAKAGKVDGYVKPLFHNLELLSLKKADKDLNPLHLATDAIGSLLNLVLQNQRKQQLATEVPFSGRIDDPSVDIPSTLLNLLKNAVVKAFEPEFNGSDHASDKADSKSDQKPDAKSDAKSDAK